MNIAVLGNGQLGAMMQQAGLRIGVGVQLLDIDAGELDAPDMIVTAEREHWPQNPFTTSLVQAPGWLNATAFHHLADRLRQKTLITNLGLPTAPWRAFNPALGQSGIHDALGPDVFLKSSQGGYDGRGQLRLKQATPTALPFPEWAEQSLAEQAIPFDTEVSIIGARGRDGAMVFYRLTENRHQDGVLAISISRPGAFDALQAPAGAVALPGAFGYVYLPAALGVALASVFAAPWGTRLAHALSGQALKQVFALFLLLVGGAFAYSAMT